MIEMVVDGSMHGSEFLRVLHEAKAMHRPLSLSERRVRIQHFIDPGEPAQRKAPEAAPVIDNGVMFETMRYERLTKRELLKQTRAAWAAIGQPLPRGATLPPWSEAGPRLKCQLSVFHELLAQMSDGTPMSERKIAERLSDMLRW